MLASTDNLKQFYCFYPSACTGSRIIWIAWLISFFFFILNAMGPDLFSIWLQQEELNLLVDIEILASSFFNSKAVTQNIVVMKMATNY